MTKFISFMFTSFCLFVFSNECIGAEHQKRLALVIGNSEYSNIVSLPKPVKDAALMATTLERVGFEVITKLDVDLNELNKALTEFGRLLREKAAIGLFYYSGHAVQLSGENYLIPTSINIQDESELSWQAVRLNDVLRIMKKDTSDISIVVLDAQRNNPFPSSNRSATNGLAQADAPQGTYIAYAAAPGKIVSKSSTQHSIYTSALAEAILIPGLTIEETFKTARRKVLKTTNSKQLPWDASSIIGMFRFISTDDPNLATLHDQIREQQEQISNLTQNQNPDDAANKTFSASEIASFETCNALTSSPHDNMISGHTVSYANLRKHSADAIMSCSLALKVYSNNDRIKYQLARAYLTDSSREVEAAHWMRKAAESYYPAAMNGLGVLLNHGRGVAKDDAEAFKWVSRAAEKGNIPAMTNLAVAYQTALGIKNSDEKALMWFERASKLKDARATVLLASLYSGSNQILNNVLIKSDFEIAEKLIFDNKLQQEFDVPRLLSHLYGDWPWKVIGSDVSRNIQEKYWKKSKEWRVVGNERYDRISIIQGRNRDGYIKEIEKKLEAIANAVSIPHPVDRDQVEKLYFTQAYADNLYVVFDWNRELLTDYSVFGNQVPKKYHKKIDELRINILNAKRIILRN